MGLPIRISSEVRGVYDYIEALPEGSVFLLSLDFDPASKPELYPQAIAIMRHAFHKNLRVVAMTLWVSGTGMADQSRDPMANEMGKEQRKRLCLSGMEPRGQRVHLNMGQDLYKAFPSRLWGKPTKGYPSWTASRLAGRGLCRQLGAGNPGVGSLVRLRQRQV